MATADKKLIDSLAVREITSDDTKKISDFLIKWGPRAARCSTDATTTAEEC